MEESIKQTNPYTYSPLALAYIGDSVLDLKIKEYFVRETNKQAEKYHKEVTSIVKATFQAAFVDEIINSFSEEELDVYKRGRNSSVHTKAKNATMSEYKKATGLEALIGYLYLSGNFSRVEEIAGLMIDKYLKTKE